MRACSGDESKLNYNNCSSGGRPACLGVIQAISGVLEDTDVKPALKDHEDISEIQKRGYAKPILVGFFFYRRG